MLNFYLDEKALGSLPSKRSAMKHFSLAVSLFLVIGILSQNGIAAPYNDGGRIYGGTQATVGQFPYVAAIVDASNSDQYICTGFIYNNRHVVTVASCLQGKTAPSIRVLAGRVNLGVGGVRLNVQTITLHESYNPTTKENDLALIETSSAFVYNTTVAQITYNEIDLTVTKGTTMGWGESTAGFGESLNLYSTDLTLPGNCANYTDTFVNRYMICAGTADDTGAPCALDEGAPLVQTTTTGTFVIGIASKNLICPAEGETIVTFPTIYTRLSAYYSWLGANAGPQ